MTDIPQEVLDEHRHTNVDDSYWYSALIQGFVDDMESKGVDTEAKNVSFTGFWSQGDGASFKGRLTTKVFLDAHPNLREDFPHHATLNGFDEAEPGITIEQSGHYSHEMTMSLTLMYDLNVEQHFDTEQPLGKLAYEQFDKDIDNELADFEEAVLEILRGYAKKLYSDLEKEYEHLTSDEAVKEAIEANNLWTPEEGEDGRQAA